MEEKRLLLHICCAPDATVPWPDLKEEGYETTDFFYGDNIHPKEEFDRRVESLAYLSLFFDESTVYRPYAPEEWVEETAELKDEPERGKRCIKCFELQLNAAADYAKQNNYKYLSTTLTISPHKDVALINELGKRISQENGLIWVEKIWRKNNGFKKSVERSLQLNLYRQDYCGCLYSIQSRNQI